MTVTEQVQNRLIGKTIKLLSTSDPYTRLTPGSLGRVTGFSQDVDGSTKVNVRWDNGSSLSLIHGEDSWHILTEREEFFLRMEQYVGAGYAFLNSWQSVYDDHILNHVLNSYAWPFKMSFDEYVAEMHHALDSLKEALK